MSKIDTLIKRLHEAKEAINNDVSPAKKPSALELADTLIKSLEGMVKAEPNGSGVPPAKPNTKPKAMAKPGPTLDYSTFNKKPDYKEIDANAPTINYGENRMAPPKWSGAASKAKETRDRLANQAAAEAKETAIETIQRKAGIKKAEEEEKRRKEMEKSAAEQAALNKLAKAYNQVIGAKLQPTNEEFEAAMRAQGMGVTQEQVEKAQKEHDGRLNDFFTEAMKPINSRFASEEEEIAYWRSIGVSNSAKTDF